MKLNRRKSFKRPGAPLSYGANRARNRLPRAQERVQRTLRSARLALLFGGGSVNPPPPLAKPVLQLNLPRKRLVVSPRTRKFKDPLRVLKMEHPRRVLFCVRRKARKEVLFAHSKVGYRGSSPGRRRTYRRTGNSAFRC